MKLAPYAHIVAFSIAALTGIFLANGCAHERGNSSPVEARPSYAQSLEAADLGREEKEVRGEDRERFGEILGVTSTQAQALKQATSTTMHASVSMYSRKESCHNRKNGLCITAIGRDAQAGTTVACPRSIPLGVRVTIRGHEYRCEDRTAKSVERKFGPTFDIFTEDRSEALKFGRQELEIIILGK